MALLKRVLTTAFRVFLVLVLLEVGLRVSGLLHLQAQDAMNAPVEGARRILVYGDSHTFEAGNLSWPYQLEKMLPGYDIINLAKPGVSYTYIAAHLEQDIKEYSPEALIVMIGQFGENPLQKSGQASFLGELRVVRLVLQGIDILRPHRDKQELSGEALFNKTVERRLAEDPEDHEAMLYRALYHLSYDCYPCAEEWLARSIKAKPTPTAYINLWYLYYGGQRLSDAWAITTMMEDLGFPPEEVAYYRGKTAYQARNTTLATELFTSALMHRPDHFGALFELGMINHDQGNREIAQIYFQKLLTIYGNPDWDENGYLHAAWAKMQKGSYRDAEGLFMLAFARNPDTQETSFNLGMFYVNGRQYVEGQYHLSRMGVILLEHANYPVIQHRTSYETSFKSLDEQFRDWNAIMDAGDFYLHNRRYEDLLRIYSILLDRYPDERGEKYIVYVRMSMAFIYLGQNDKAEALLTHVENTDPRMLLVIYKELAGRFRKANETEMADMFLGLYEQQRISHMDQALAESFKEIYSIAKRHDVQLMVMQYPTMDVSELYPYFPDSDVVFISNEEPFRTLLLNTSYEELFKDRQGGFFGHSTELGHRMIAENVAQAIVDLEGGAS